jgi:hypothetical protein
LFWNSGTWFRDLAFFRAVIRPRKVVMLRLGRATSNFNAKTGTSLMVFKNVCSVAKTDQGSHTATFADSALRLRMEFSERTALC